MNKQDNKRSNKRELLESDRYTKHERAKPYVRDNRVPFEELDDDAKQEFLNGLLGDWDAQ